MNKYKFDDNLKSLTGTGQLIETIVGNERLISLPKYEGSSK